MPILSNRSGNSDFHSTHYQLPQPSSEGPGSRLISGTAATLTSSVVYDFSAGSLPASVNNPAMSYGDFGQTGGRGYVAVSTTYAGLYSPNVYTFDDLYFDAFPATANGGTTEAYSSFWLDTQTQAAGTTIGFFYDGLNDDLYCSNWVGYTDASGGETVLPNARTLHPKWRLTRNGNNIEWRTSVDGITWTTQRTIAIPAWVTGSNLAFWWEAHRAEGTANQFQFDNLNVPVAAGTVYALSGSSATTPASTGQLATISDLSGQSVATPLATGAFTLFGDLSGQSVASPASSGQFGTLAGLSGQAVATPLSSGQFGTLAALSGQSVATPVSTGQLVLSRPLSGASAVTPVAAGSLTGRVALSGASVTSVVSAGQLIRVQPIEPSSSTVAPSSSGVLKLATGPVTLSLSGAATVTPVSSGSLAAPGQTSGASVVVPEAAGSFTVLALLSGASTATPTAAGSITNRGQVAGASVATAISSGQLSTVATLSGQSVATPVSAATLSVGQAPLVLSGASTVSPSSAGLITRRSTLAGAGVISPGVTGTLVLRVVITGTAASAPAATGSFGQRMMLAGATTRSAVSSGSLLLVGLTPDLTFPIDVGFTQPGGGWTPEISQHLTPPIAGSITSPM